MVTPVEVLTSDFVPLCLGIPENAGVTYMYGPHLHRRTMMVRMLWVMMGCLCPLLHQVWP